MEIEKTKTKQYDVCTRVRIAYAISVCVEVQMIFMHIFDNLQQVLCVSLIFLTLSFQNDPFHLFIMWFIWMRASTQLWPKCENIFETKNTIFTDWLV